MYIHSNIKGGFDLLDGRTGKTAKTFKTVAEAVEYAKASKIKLHPSKELRNYRKSVKENS